MFSSPKALAETVDVRLRTMTDQEPRCSGR